MTDLPEAVKIICQLVVSSARVRGACLRNNTVPILVHHIQHKDSVAALTAIAGFSRGKQEVARFKHMIANAFRNNTALDISLAANLFRLMIILNVSFDCSRVVERLVQLSTHETGWDVLATIAFLRRVPSTSIEEALPRMNSGEPTAITNHLRLMTYLAHRSPTLTRAVAVKYGDSIVKSFIQCKDESVAQCKIEDFLPLLYTLAPHMPADTFRVPLLGVGTVPDAHMMLFRMVFYYVRDPIRGQQIVKEILESTEWFALRTALHTRLRQLIDVDSCFRVIVPTLLLTAFIANTHALTSETVELLSRYLLRCPHLFKFECDDNPLLLRKIIGIGETLAIPSHIMGGYRDRLAFADWVEQSHKELTLTGIPDWKPPDAFCCPVTLELMREPVIASDGHTYERTTLQRLLETTRCSPLTRERLETSVMVPNFNLKKRIRDLPEEVCGIIRRARHDL